MYVSSLHTLGRNHFPPRICSWTIFATEGSMDGCRTTKKIKNQQAHKQHPQGTEGALGAEALSHGAYSEGPQPCYFQWASERRRRPNDEQLCAKLTLARECALSWCCSNREKVGEIPNYLQPSSSAPLETPICSMP